MASRYIYVDGKKSIDLPKGINNPWKFYGEQEQNEPSFYANVSAMFRACNLSADALSNLPFAIVKGEEDFDTSDSWKNKVGFMPNPKELIRLWRLSLIMTNTAYGFMEQTKGVKKLRYILSSSITPITNQETGLVGFKRTVGNSPKEYYIGDKPQPILYMWRLDHTTELLPSINTEFEAMKNAAGILFYSDWYINSFIQRGGIKPSVMLVKGVPNKADREEIESIWDKIMRGYYKYLGKVFNADAIDVKQVGEGIENIKDQALMNSKVSDIAMAIGMPLSLLLANSANYSTAMTEYSGWYRDSITPWANFIQDCLNEQIFTALGMRFEFRPEISDPGQEDEVQRAGAFNIYCNRMKPSIAAQIVGIELPEGVEYKDLDGDEGKEEAPLEEKQEPEPTTDTITAVPAPAKFIPSMEQYQELIHWKDIAIRKFTRGDTLSFTWQPKSLPASISEDISSRIAECLTITDINKAFSIEYIDPVLLELQRANDLLTRAIKYNENHGDGGRFSNGGAGSGNEGGFDTGGSSGEHINDEHKRLAETYGEWNPISDKPWEKLSPGHPDRTALLRVTSDRLKTRLNNLKKVKKMQRAKDASDSQLSLEESDNLIKQIEDRLQDIDKLLAGE